jgi:hypothetical protein
MIHLPDHLVGFYHKNKGQTTQTAVSEEDTTSHLTSISGIDPAERGPLTYLAGYVVAKLFQTSKRAKKSSQATSQLAPGVDW